MPRIRLPPTGRDLDVVVARMLAFAEEAGRIALACRAEGLRVDYKAGDLGQALTQADLTISRLLHARFGPRLIEEETAELIGAEAAGRLLDEADWTFVGDPIDGTKPFAGGLAGWGTMVAACWAGRAVAGVAHLPAWCDDRARLPGDQDAPAGILLAAWAGTAWWAPTRGGTREGPLRLLPRPRAVTHHIGWLAPAAALYTLDYGQGLFPWCESSTVADVALVATGRLDATLSNHKLWDLAPVLPILEATGFSLYRWPDLAPPPAPLLALFDTAFACRDELWLVCRDREQASRLAQAIRRAG